MKRSFPFFLILFLPLLSSLYPVTSTPTLEFAMVAVSPSWTSDRWHPPTRFNWQPPSFNRSRYGSSILTAIVLNPFGWQFGASELDSSIDEIRESGYTVKWRNDSLVTVNWLKNGGMVADLVFWRGHGIWPYYSSAVDSEMAGLVTGELVTTATILAYSSDIADRRLIEGVLQLDNGATISYWTCTQRFFAYYYKSKFKSTQFFYTLSCFGMYQNLIGMALVDSGKIGATMGYNTLATVHEGDLKTNTIFWMLLVQRKTVAETQRTLEWAYYMSWNGYGANHLVYYGNGGLTLRIR